MARKPSKKRKAPPNRRKARKPAAVSGVMKSASIPGRMKVIAMGQCVAIDYTAPGVPETMRHTFKARPKLYRTSDGDFVVIPLPRKAGKYLEG